MKLSEMAEHLTMLTTVYPSYEPTDAAVRMWHSLFGEVDNATFGAAIRRHMLASKFVPTPADISPMLNAQQYPEMSEAWKEIRNRIQYVGWYGIPEFSHPLIEHVVDAIGWKVLCDMTNSDTMRAHFFKLYGSATKRYEETGQLPASPRKELRPDNPADSVELLANGMKEIE
jgi:hypothetical protein